MNKPVNEGSNSTRATQVPALRNRKKRDIKYYEKSGSSSDEESKIEEIKLKLPPKTTERDRYFTLGNSIYQEYDNFLKKRKRDRKAEFIKLRRDSNEEVLSFSNNKDLLKYFGAPISDQDTFCF